MTEGCTIWEKTASDLAEAAKNHRCVLVGYSGGKDSRATVELCHRAFKSVHLYHLYYVPSLPCIERELQWAEKRWGTSVIRYPHPNFLSAIQSGHYGFPTEIGDASRPNPGIVDILAELRNKVGATLVALGHKETDGAWRRHLLNAQYKTQKEIIFPIRKWNKYEVMAFLQSANIPIPSAYDDTSMSINDSVACIRWLADKEPESFRQYCKFFPFAEAVVKRDSIYKKG